MTRKISVRPTSFRIPALLGAMLVPAAAAGAQVTQSTQSDSVRSRPSKLLIVFEENKSFEQIIGNPDAPYMNQLAAEGMLFTSFYALTHPSQPNYFEFFSGTNQGTSDNTNPAVGSPFNTPNLAASLVQAGFSFIGYAEGLPAPGSTASTSGPYTRLTNPWVNWQASGDPGINQILPTQNLPFTQFPSDFNQLPDVSIVIPDLMNNSHDGTIAQSDQWLFAHIKPFAEWARENNGLLILTYDEDEGGPSRNRIVTIFYGPMIRAGTNNATWTLHNLLRTVQEMYGAAPSGLAERVRPMTGYLAQSGDGILPVRFRNGANGYTGTVDTYLDQTVPNIPHGGLSYVTVVDAPRHQGLIRFDGIVGAGAGQIPQGSTVLSAKLSVNTAVLNGGDRSFDTIWLHRMLMDWNESATWDSMEAGVSLDDVEAAAAGEFSVIPNVGLAWAIFDVTASVQGWVNDPATNHGWVTSSSGNDLWRFGSSEWGLHDRRPVLEVVIRTPAGPGAFGLLSPPNAAVNLPTEPTLTWQKAADATQYTVKIAIDPSLSPALHSGSVTGPSYVVPPGVLEACSIYYWGVMASNAYGSTLSNPASAVFTTVYPADYNHDGFVDGIDYDEFHNAFEAGEAGADYNQDGFVDGIDYDLFNNDFEAGC